MDMTKESCREFVRVLASNAPAPGGAGAAAVAGTLGTALGNMVGALTVGKKKYREVEEEILALMARCDELQTLLLDQVQSDEEHFLPLARAYGIPKTDPSRAQILEEATADACTVPLVIMQLCLDSLECIALFARKGSRLALSDAGCGAALCKAAAQAASLNVFVNTQAMQDRENARSLNRRAEELLQACTVLGDQIFGDVLLRLTQ